MLRYRKCEYCNEKILEGKFCDTCGIQMQNQINLSFGYGHDLDSASYDFCNYQCLLQFIIEELKK